MLEIAHGNRESADEQLATKRMLKTKGSRIIHTSRAASNLQVVVQYCACETPSSHFADHRETQLPEPVADNLTLSQEARKSSLMEAVGR